MAVERFEIALRDGRGQEAAARITLEEVDGAYVAKLESPWYSGSASAEDYFEAFAAVRRELAAQSIYPVCYGASRNVYPSGMSRSMGGGLRAYRMTLGKQALKQDLVGIFDRGPDVEPVTPEEQRRFFEQWVASLGVAPPRR